MARLSFCLKAATTLHDADLSVLTDSIEHYVRAGMDTVQAEKSAVDDLMAHVKGERDDMVGLLKKQHADAFTSDRQEPEAPPKEVSARKPPPKGGPVRGSDALGQVSTRLGGISPDLLSDLSSKVTRTRTGKTGNKTEYTAWDNPMQPGSGPLFRKGGTADLSEVARVLEEEGYITKGTENPEKRAEEIIKAELASGGSTLREGDADAIEEHGRAMQAAHEEEPWDSFMFTPDDLEEAGYNEITDPKVREATQRLVMEADALGLDTEGLKEDSARQTAEEHEDTYHEHLQSAIREAVAEARRAPGGSERAAAPAGNEGGRAASREEPVARGEHVADRPDGQARGRDGLDPFDPKGKTPEELQKRIKDLYEEANIAEELQRAAKFDSDERVEHIAAMDRAMDEARRLTKLLPEEENHWPEPVDEPDEVPPNWRESMYQARTYARQLDVEYDGVKQPDLVRAIEEHLKGYTVTEKGDKFYLRIGDDGATHGPFKTRAAAAKQGDSLAGTKLSPELEQAKGEAKASGAALLGKRQMNAAESFITSAMEQFKLTRPEAERALKKMQAEKLVTLGANDGQFKLKDGRFWEQDVMRRAAGWEEKPILEAQDTKTLKAKTEREAAALAAEKAAAKPAPKVENPDEFTLTGSNRKVDANPDQKSMFSLPAHGDFEDTQILHREPEVSEAHTDPEQEAALASVQAEMRGRSKSWQSLKLTAMPRLEEPGRGASFLEQMRYAASELGSKLLGKDVVFFHSNLPFANGIQSPANPKHIFISEDSTRPVMAVLGHESLHSLRNAHPELYDQLAKRVDGLLKDPSAYATQLAARYESRGIKVLTGDKAREELIADIVGDNFTSPEFWRRMSQGQPALFQRVLGKIRDFLNGVLQKLKGENPYGTAKYLNDVQAARDAVVDAMTEFAKRAESSRDVTEPTERAIAEGTNLSDHNEPFYSQLSREMATAPMKQGSGEAWGDYLKGLVKKGAVKADEVAWTGLDDYLKMEGGKVTREQVMDFLGQHGVKVEETHLGGGLHNMSDELRDFARADEGTIPSDADGWLKLSTQAEDEAQRLQGRGFAAKAEAHFRLAEEANEMAERYETPSGGDDMTKFSQYTLPGGSNYREVLLTLPRKDVPFPTSFAKYTDMYRARFPQSDASPMEISDYYAKRLPIPPEGKTVVAGQKEPVKFQSGHWNQPNVLAHVRLNDRTDAGGKRVLFVEEIQSDWAQQGKKQGFKGETPAADAFKAFENDVRERFREHIRKDVSTELKPDRIDAWVDNMVRNSSVGDMARAIGEEPKAIELQRAEMAEMSANNRAVPQAPFVGKTDAWVSLAMKRVIKMAADEGYDRVAFVNGEQSAKRYSLSKQVDSVSWENTRADGATKNVELAVKGSNPIRLRVEQDGKIAAAVGPGFSQFIGKGLDEVIGKDLAAKIMAEPKNGSLEGTGLDVGGDGMKAFYDQIVPKVAKELAKKLGGEGLKNIDIGARDRNFAKSSGEQEKPEGRPVGVVENNRGMLTIEMEGSDTTWGSWSPSGDGPAMAARRLKELQDAYQENAHSQVGFDITPAMREKAAGGLPMFSLRDTPEEEARARNLPGRSVLNRSLSRVSELIDHALDESGIYKLVAPMSSGTDRTRAMAQAHINAERVANRQWMTVDAELKKSFTPEERKTMWEAADQQNDLLTQGRVPGPDEGINRLTPEQREVMDTLHAYSRKLWRMGKAAGLVEGDGVPYWAPRMMAMMVGDDFAKPGEPGKKTTSSGDGRNIVTSAGSAKARKYDTSAESDAAMNALGGTLVRDIRTMPLAMARFERAIAGRELINQIKDLGTATGHEMVSTSRQPNFFTLDHPAFTTSRPRMKPDGTPVLTELGNPVMDRTPIYINKEFEGPLKAIMSNTDGNLYKGYMLLKSKAMSAIMVSPLIHNMVIAGRAFAYAGVKLPALYFTGNRARADQDLMRQAISHGMVPIDGTNHTMSDVGDIARGFGKEGGWFDPNESFISHGAKVAGNLIKAGLGDKAKAGIDRAGDFWHGTLLWNRVGDLQAGLYQHAYNRLIAKGVDQNAAATVAAHMANRYAGAVGRENMSETARKFLNVTLFSRSFNTGNVGAVKDVFYGLPAGLKAQLFKGSDPESALKALGFAKRKAIAGLIMDAGATILLTSVVQNIVQRNKDDPWAQQLEDAMMGYGDRAAEMWANAKKHPLSPGSYDPYRLSATWHNEPGKQDRVDMGAQPSGRHEYMRLPTGKVVEDTIGWLTKPVDTFEKKMSPLAKSAMDIAKNDKGFGVPVWDPSGSWGAFAVDVAKHLVESEVPIDTIKAGKRMLDGTATDIDKKKFEGNLTGLSISQGHPGGPEAAVAQQTTDRIEKSKKYVMQAVRQDINSGDTDRARERLDQIGLTNKEVNSIIHRIEAPKVGGMTNAQKKTFKKHATEEEQETMDSVGQ